MILYCAIHIINLSFSIEIELNMLCSPYRFFVWCRYGSSNFVFRTTDGSLSWISKALEKAVRSRWPHLKDYDHCSVTHLEWQEAFLHGNFLSEVSLI